MINTPTKDQFTAFLVDTYDSEEEGSISSAKQSKISSAAEVSKLLQYEDDSSSDSLSDEDDVEIPKVNSLTFFQWRDV